MAPDCPKCTESFDSWAKLRYHHKSSHDESLPNCECEECGKAYFSKHHRKYCSDECRYANRSNEGSNNPNYRGGKETTTCEICGTAFEYYPSEKPGLYCPNCVENEQWRTLPDISGENNPRWNGGKRAYECEVCSAQVRRYPSNAGEIVVCGEDCRHEWLSDAFTGEGHPNWKGGDIGPYGPGWAAARERALERDGHACVICGTDREELGRNPDVHHVVPVRAFVETAVTAVADAHYVGNLVSLCPPCHRRAEVRAITQAELREAVAGAGHPRMESVAGEVA